MKHSLYKLLEKLDSSKLFYTIGRHRSDTILVCVTFVGLRVEIDVFDDGHMDVCCFRGNESIEGGAELIYKLIEDSADKP